MSVDKNELAGELIPGEGEANRHRAEQERALASLSERFGDGRPFDLTRAESQYDAEVERAGAAIIRAGCWLVLIKEHLKPGEWLAWLARKEIGTRQAQRFMQLARTYWTPNREKLVERLGHSKALLLVAEDDEPLDELADGGTYAGLSVDELACCTKAELADLVRKERAERKADAEAKDRLLADKNKHIDDLAERLTRAETGRNTPDGLTGQQAQRLESTVIAACAALLDLQQAAVEIGERADAPEPLTQACAAALLRVRAVFDDTAGLLASIGGELAGLADDSWIETAQAALTPDLTKGRH